MANKTINLFGESVATPGRAKAALRRYYRCKTCDKSFLPKSQRYKKYCSRKCAFSDHKAWFKHRPKVKIKKEYVPRCKVCAVILSRRSQYCDDHRPIYISKPQLRHCRKCNKELGIKSAKSKLCEKCRKKGQKERHRLKHGKVRKHRHRARKYGVKYEPINPLTVFERDGWHCQVCGVRTPKRLRGTYKPNAPELDHRIPMHMGGSHTWDNVQCCCRKCNSEKQRITVGQTNMFPMP